MLTYNKPERAAWLLASFDRFAKKSGILDKLDAQPHDEMIAEMEACIPDFELKRGQKRELYLAPRYTFKTSIAIAFVVYLILRFPDISISIYRASRLLSKDMLGAICDILTRNPEILATFGDLSENAPMWTTFKITVNTRTRTGVVDPTIAVFGLKSSMAGTHPDFVLMDDLVTEINCDSIVEMQKAEKLVESSYPVLPLGWGSLLITGTEWSAIDVYWKIREKNKVLIEAGKRPDFKEYIRTVYVRDEQGELQLFFPRDLTEEFLERQRESISARMYAAWYFQEVRELGMAPFPRDKIKFFDGLYEYSPVHAVRLQLQPDSESYGDPLPLYVALITDPALTAAASSDNFGNNVVGWDHLKRWWVFESQEWRKLPSDAAASIIKLIAKYQPDCWLIEAQNADPEMVDMVMNFIRGARLPTVIRRYSALQDEPAGLRGKQQRILALEPKFHRGMISLRRRACAPLLRQLDNYPSLEHDDCLDSLAMGRKLEIHAPRTDKVEFVEDDREPVDRFHAGLDEMEIRPPGTGTSSGVPRGGWSGPLTLRS